MAQPGIDLWDSSFWSALVALRRELHMHPEPGFKETRTQERLREVLEGVAGIPTAQIRPIAITGLVVDIHGTAAARPGGPLCVALRTDLDALTMTEGNHSLPYRSKNEGVAHMCGHDGHMASVVATAILLQRRRDRIPSNLTVRLLMQPAEESSPAGTGGYDYAVTGGGGAMPMIMEGALEGVDEVYGWHNWPAWPLGELRVAVGPVMARATFFDVVIRGKGGHGSQPHLTIDPLVCGAAVVTALQTVVSRSLPSSSNAVVSITEFHCGERYNVTADQALLRGTIRDVDEAVFANIRQRFTDIVEGVCQGFNCSCEVSINSLYPPVVNPPEGVEVVKRCATKLEGSLALDVCTEGMPMMGAEDFAFFLQKRPGCFYFLGTGEPLTVGLAAFDGADGNPRSNCICHGTSFDFNDNALPRAVAMMLRIVEDRFSLQLYSQEEMLGASICA